MSNTLNLQALNIEELQEITENAHKLIEQKRHERLLTAYQEFENIAKGLDTDIQSILKAGEELQRIRNIKYRDHNNAENVWTGRGRKPTWLTTAIENGHKLEDFAI